MKVPISHNAELGALCLMTTDDSILATQEWIPEYFAIEAHRTIFTAIKGVHQRTGTCNAFTAVSELESMKALDALGGPMRVNDLLSSLVLPKGETCRTMANDYRIELLKAKGYRDSIKLWEDNETLIRNGEADLKEIGGKFAIACDDPTIQEVKLNQRILQVVENLQGTTQREKIPTGIRTLDRTYLKGGMHRGEMFTVAGEPGGGKSIFLVQAALGALQEGKSVVFYSLEMDANDIIERMAANLAQVEIEDELDSTSKRNLAVVLAKIAKMPLTLRDNLLGIDEIERDAVRLAALKAADVIVIDYIQIVESEGDSREQQVSNIARQMKNLATRCNAVVYTASQLNDDGKVRESRAIKQHTNQLAIIKAKGDKTIFYMDKNRRGKANDYFQIDVLGGESRIEDKFV